MHTFLYQFVMTKSISIKEIQHHLMEIAISTTLINPSILTTAPPPLHPQASCQICSASAFRGLGLSPGGEGHFYFELTGVPTKNLGYENPEGDLKVKIDMH